MPAKKSTKTAKQKLKKTNLDLRTFRGKMIVFALVFATLGGVYLAYNTFAATSTTVYSVANLQQLYAENSRLVTESSGDKRELRVWDLYSKGSGETKGGTVQTITGVKNGFKDVVYAKEYFRVCALVRGVSGVQKFSLTSTSAYRGYDIERVYFTAYTSPNYYKHCTSWKYGLDLTVPRWGLGGKVDRARNTDPGSIRLSSINIEYK